MRAQDQGDNLVVSPRFQGAGCNDQVWQYWSPRSDLVLKHEIRDSDGALLLGPTDDRHAFGCWKAPARLDVGQWYRASVTASIHGIEQPEISVFAQVAQHFLVPVERVGDDILLQQTFQHTNADDGNDFELFLRSTSTGSVEWRNPRVVSTTEPAPRVVRVAAVRFGKPSHFISRDAQTQRMAEKLDLAGKSGAAIVCLPEFASAVGTEYEESFNSELAERVPTGPVCNLLASKSREHSMYVIAGILEKRGAHIFNTAVIFGRGGELVGQYDKTHLTFNELKWGISCGDSYPVFDLEFGRIAIHICYDEWFPEVARLYAHQGAEILFLPVMGGKPITWRTRALDNGIYFVSSAVTPPSMIIDSSGEIIAETRGDGVVVADLDLVQRRVNWYGDPTLSYGMPCIVPQMRNVLDNELIERLSASMLLR